MFNTPFMAWIDYLPEVGDPIRNARSRLLEMASEAAELERHALALRTKLHAGQVELLARVMQNWPMADVERAAERAAGLDANAGVLENVEPTLRDKLRALDSTHLAAEALLAFHDGGVIAQHNLLSTATDEERRQALHRLLTWWNVAAAPIYDRLCAAMPAPTRSRPRGSSPRL